MLLDYNSSCSFKDDTSNGPRGIWPRTVDILPSWICNFATALPSLPRWYEDPSSVFDGDPANFMVGRDVGVHDLTWHPQFWPASAWWYQEKGSGSCCFGMPKPDIIWLSGENLWDNDQIVQSWGWCSEGWCSTNPHVVWMIEPIIHADWYSSISST